MTCLRIWKLVFTNPDGWIGPYFTLTPASFYHTETINGSKVCETHPKSGSDRSLNGGPGGTLNAYFTDTSKFWEHDFYLLDLRGYVDAPYPCDDGP